MMFLFLIRQRDFKPLKISKLVKMDKIPPILTTHYLCFLEYIYMFFENLETKIHQFKINFVHVSYETFLE